MVVVAHKESETEQKDKSAQLLFTACLAVKPKQANTSFRTQSHEFYLGIRYWPMLLVPADIQLSSLGLHL